MQERMQNPGQNSGQTKANAPLHKAPSGATRWLVLLFVSLAMFGNYYIFDALSPVVDLLQADLDFSYQQIGWLWSSYNVAAVVILLIGGVIIDRFGTRRAIFVFALVCLLAAGLRAATPNFWVMLAGQVLLGLGAEPLIVAATATLAKWFKGRELSFAFGLNLSISRLGSASADWSTSIAKPLYTNWQDPLWLATAVAAVSVTAAILYWITENRVERQQVQLGQADAPDQLDFKSIFSFSRSYWYIVALCVVFYATVFPFRSFAIDYFQQAHSLSREAAGLLSSMLPVAAIIATPLFGLWVDRVGKRSVFMLIGSFMMLPLFLLVSFLPPGPLITIGLPLIGFDQVPMSLFFIMLMLGIVFSLIPAVMWPSVAYIVSENRLGSAYAMMTFCQQVGWSLVPLIVGMLNDYFQASAENISGYQGGMYFYTALSLAGVFFAFKLWQVEQGKNAHGLDKIKTG